MVIVAMKGPPGSGKSALARALSRDLGWPLVDKDDVKDVLDGHTPLADSLAYEVMLRVARRQLVQGLDIFVDSPLLERTYHGVRAIASAAGAVLVVVECRCSDEVAWRTRVEARQSAGLPPHHTTTWEGVQGFLRQPGVSFAIAEPCLVVDTARPLPAVLGETLAWLNGNRFDGAET